MNWKYLSTFLIGIIGVFLGFEIHPVFFLLFAVCGAIANDCDRDDREKIALKRAMDTAKRMREEIKKVEDK